MYIWFLATVVAILFTGFSPAAEAPAPEGNTYTNQIDGFAFFLPTGWDAARTRFPLNYLPTGTPGLEMGRFSGGPARTFLTVDNQRVGFHFRESDAPLQPGEIFITFSGLPESGVANPRRPLVVDTPIQVYRNFLAAADLIQPSSASELSGFGIPLNIHGKPVNLTVYMRQPVSAENNRQLRQLLDSLQFTDQPTTPTPSAPANSNPPPAPLTVKTWLISLPKNYALNPDELEIPSDPAKVEDYLKTVRDLEYVSFPALSMVNTSKGSLALASSTPKAEDTSYASPAAGFVGTFSTHLVNDTVQYTTDISSAFINQHPLPSGGSLSETNFTQAEWTGQSSFGQPIIAQLNNTAGKYALIYTFDTPNRTTSSSPPPKPEPGKDSATQVQAVVYSPAKIWSEGENINLGVLVRNRRTTALDLPAQASFALLQVDGVWYRNQGKLTGTPVRFESSPIEEFVLNKGKFPNDNTVSIAAGTDHAFDLVENLDSGNWVDGHGQPFALPSGKHSVRFALRVPKHDPAIKLDDTSIVYSNTLTVEITKSPTSILTTVSGTSPSPGPTKLKLPTAIRVEQANRTQYYAGKIYPPPAPNLPVDTLVAYYDKWEDSNIIMYDNRDFEMNIAQFMYLEGDPHPTTPYSVTVANLSPDVLITEPKGEQFYFGKTPPVSGAKYIVEMEINIYGPLSTTVPSAGGTSPGTKQLLWSGTLSHKVEILSAVPPYTGHTSADPTLWGDAVKGLQIRLRPSKTDWQEWEAPDFSVDIRNTGTDTLYGDRGPGNRDDSLVEVDGKRYALASQGWRATWPDGTPIGMSIGSTWSPGTDASNIATTKFTASQLVNPWQTLAPGKHVVRWVLKFPGSTVYTESGATGELLSNPVTINILPLRAPPPAELEATIVK